MATTSRHVGVETSSSAIPLGASVRVEIRGSGPHLLLVVTGEADLSTAQALREDLGAALTRRPCSVALEISGLTYCDLAGLDALNDFCAEASVAGVPPVVQGMSPRLAWMQAMFPAPNGMPSPAGGSAASVSLGSRHERWLPGHAPLGTPPAEPVAPPRPWPER